jgi:chromosome segregation ATPase
MSESTQLAARVEQIESKASNYETATQFEATLERYTNRLRSVTRSLASLEQDLYELEFHTAVLAEVVDPTGDVPGAVNDARRSAQSVVEHDEDYYYELADQNRTDQYEQRVQEVRSEVSVAMNAVEDRLRDEERTWVERVNAARNVQKLFGQPQEAARTLDDIERFVSRKMWDSSNSITSLDSEWQGLRRSWRRVGVDWSTVKDRHGLSDDAIDVLKQLAKGDSVRLGQLEDGVATDLLSVEKLHDEVTLSI